MIKLQNPNIPAPVAAIEIDRAIYEIQMKLDTKLAWLSHDYGRSYRFVEMKNKRLYFPEVYIGGKKNAYHRVTPDNDKKGMCFFVVGKEENNDFDQFHYNFLKWDIGIIFSVNLDKINSGLLNTEVFTQNLIRDVREVLTRQLGGLSFTLHIKNVVQEFRDIYREFSLEEDEQYLRAPQSGFRFNCTVTLQEECDGFMFDPKQALIQNISNDEIVSVLLPTIDFSDDDNFNSLTSQQKTDLLSKLQ